MDELKKIPSFQKDHNTLMPGLHEGNMYYGVTTWDLRFKKPNAGDFIEQKALHSLEHMLATLLRNHKDGNSVVYFGPMGCRTGFYLLTVKMGGARVKKMLLDCFTAALDLSEVPGAKKEECGNYLEHDLDGAKEECRKYLKILKTRVE